MEIETAFGVSGARDSANGDRAREVVNPLRTTLRRADPGAGDAGKVSLSAVEHKIAASLGLSDEEFARGKAAKATRAGLPAKSPYGLTAAQRGVCRSLGLSERQFAIGAGHAEHREEAGLLRAHDEIDRAHAATYDQHHSANPPDSELLNSALAELKAYDPNDDASYDRLLKGVVYAARLLNRVAPAYADQKEIKD